MTITDIPSPIDLRIMSDALAWEAKAMERPFREEFFEAVATELIKQGRKELTILELGSGPGFLASCIMTRLPLARMVLLDFSSAMHTLARKRLAPFTDRITFIERDFKEPNWTKGLGTFDAVVTLQAVHELRHKHHAEEFHHQVKRLLNNQGQYLVCDHYCGEGAMQNDQLYMTLAEQRISLENAGFAVTDILIKGGRALYHAA